MTDLLKRARNFAHLEDTDAHCLVEELADEIERLREALKRQLRHTLNSDLPRAPQDYNSGKRALEGKDD